MTTPERRPCSRPPASWPPCWHPSWASCLRIPTTAGERHERPRRGGFGVHHRGAGACRGRGRCGPPPERDRLLEGGRPCPPEPPSGGGVRRPHCRGRPAILRVPG